MERGSLTEEFEGKLISCFYQRMCRRRPGKWISLSMGETVGKLWGNCWVAPLLGITKDVLRLRKWEFVSKGAPFWGTCGDGHLFLGPFDRMV
jgi:hypothetical protein